MRTPFVPTFIVTIAILRAAGFARADELNQDQQLIAACHRLDVDGVVSALRRGAGVNARYGEGDPKVFQDRWSLGWPKAAKRWTPLIALADSSPYPDPPRAIENSSEGLRWADEQKKKIPAGELERRRQKTLTIALVLLSHKPDIDADDGYGATALYTAVYMKKEELAKLLLRYNANVNTETGIYIDGARDETPLHRAYWSAELTKLLLEKGADPTAKDTDGKTPRDWARDNPAVQRLYESR
jgi:hypothetical protein